MTICSKEDLKVKEENNGGISYEEGHVDTLDDDWDDLITSKLIKKQGDETGTNIESRLTEMEHNMLEKGKKKVEKANVKKSPVADSGDRIGNGYMFFPVYMELTARKLDNGKRNQNKSVPGDRYTHEISLLKRYIEDEEKEGEASAEELALLRCELEKAMTNRMEFLQGEDEDDDDIEGDDDEDICSRRFQEYLRKNPGSCIRHCREGEPMWSMKQSSKIDIEICPCGRKRIFEMQLLPALNYHLKVDSDYLKSRGSVKPNERLISDMNWGTICVWTCPVSCTQSAQEVVHVQAENY